MRFDPEHTHHAPRTATAAMLTTLSTNRRLAACWLLWGACTVAAASTPGEVDFGGMLRETRMQGLTGPAKQLSEFRGKPLLINVWASWCGPCQQEMPSLERLAQKYGGKQFQVIGVSTDDYPDKANRFLKVHKITFSNFIDHNLVLENMLGADRLPLTLLIDSRGMVLDKHYGFKQWDSPEALTLISKTFQVKL
jgi:thiol-disulfide isomerase/thioredoxin